MGSSATRAPVALSVTMRRSLWHTENRRFRAASKASPVGSSQGASGQVEVTLPLATSMTAI
jgi:hypothetical protein